MTRTGSSTAGWRPQQQIQVVSFASSDIAFHHDVAMTAARLARKFNGRVGVLIDPMRYDTMTSASVEIPGLDGGHLLERIVGAEWLDEFLTHDESRFWK